MGRVYLTADICQNKLCDVTKRRHKETRSTSNQILSASSTIFSLSSKAQEEEEKKKSSSFSLLNFTHTSSTYYLPFQGQAHKLTRVTEGS